MEKYTLPRSGKRCSQERELHPLPSSSWWNLLLDSEKFLSSLYRVIYLPPTRSDNSFKRYRNEILFPFVSFLSPHTNTYIYSNVEIRARAEENGVKDEEQQGLQRSSIPWLRTPERMNESPRWTGRVRCILCACNQPDEGLAAILAGPGTMGDAWRNSRKRNSSGAISAKPALPEEMSPLSRRPVKRSPKLFSLPLSNFSPCPLNLCESVTCPPLSRIFAFILDSREEEEEGGY